MKVHLVAICGTGMGSLAGLMQAAGHEVGGSDKAFYPPMSDSLHAWGIPTMQGFSAEHIREDLDLVIVGNACHSDNPEAGAAIEAGIEVKSFPQALSEMFIKGRRSLVVAGTHGKTTTSALLSFLLTQAGRDPSFLIGGIVENFGRSFGLGGGKEFVVEGDEYDSAFFDKRPKFLHYQPEIAVLTSVEFDHADIYSDMDAYRTAFREFIHLLPHNGLLVACDDDPEVRSLISEAECEVVPYGLAEGNGFRAREISNGNRGSSFSLEIDGSEKTRIESPLYGDHNVANTLAVLAVAARLGLSPDDAGPMLSSFRGVARRMQIRGTRAGVTVIDDFAHHPTEVAKTVKAARERYPSAELVAVFEPRTNTSRRAFFQDRYPESFYGADRVIVVPPYASEKIAANQRFDSQALIEDLRRRGLQADCLPDASAVIKDLTASAAPETVILVMSNGAFDDIHVRLLGSLKAREEEAHE
jgi:UDP-N-acetylmuramate: L-alanyl-gamma-D-glutamyl-meso-diaminopimelate ligase